MAYGLTTRLKPTLTKFVAEARSVTVGLKVPLTVGVPEISPVAALMLMPAGRFEALQPYAPG